MKTWDDSLKEITEISELEKKQLEFVARFTGILIERRQKLGLTQRELAELSGVKQPVLARMESGATIPKLETLFKLAHALGMKDITIVFDEQAATAIAG